MTQVFLDGKEVFVKENNSIKLIRENPFFTKAGSSTLNIVLPMHIEQNIKVLGYINRLDCIDKPITMAAKIVSGNKTLITGEAIITEVTAENVKVQILGGTSLMNFHNKMEDIYIDELDLGKWGMSYAGSSQATNVVYPLFMALWYDYSLVGPGYNKDRKQEEFREVLFGLDNEWVAFPIYNETSGVMCNDWIFRSDPENDYKIYLEPRVNIGDEVGNGYPQVRFVVQPYLLPMIEKVFKKLGYTIDLNSLKSNELFSKIFIASANERAQRNKALPHWTVKDFITQIEIFFGATFDVDEDSKHITIMRRSDYISRGSYFVNEILDEFTISKDDNKNALSTSNVGYKEVDKFAKIEPWILENAKHKHYSTHSEFLKEYYQDTDLLTASQSFYDKYKGYIIHIDDTGIEMVCKKPEGSAFEGGPTPANYFKDRIVKNNSELDIELKIVPVNIVKQNAVAVYLTYENKDSHFNTYVGDNYYMSAPDYPVRTWEEERATTEENIIVDVEAAINGEENFYDSKDDLMRIAINAGAFSLHNNWIEIPGTESTPILYPKPLVYSWQQEFNKDAQPNITSYGLNLCVGRPTISLATEVYNSEPIVDTQKKYCIKFITDGILNPGYKFIIHNQTFLCEKLEYDIKDTGLEKLVTGYFYRLEE